MIPTQEKIVQRYLKDLRQYPPMKRREEEETIRFAKKGDRKAIERLITSNLRFVVQVALEFQGRGVPLADLISEGNMGLMTAIDRFDEKRGLKLISYAVWWIRQAIQNSLKHISSVRQPLNRQDDKLIVARRRGEMEQKLSRFPTLEEVAGDLKISQKRAARALKTTTGQDASLDRPLDHFSGDNNKTLLDIFPSGAPAPDEDVTAQDWPRLINEALVSLDGREALVIRLYFGLGGEDGLTLEQIGVKLKVTRERVRQIKEKALKKLNRFFRQNVALLREESWKAVL